MLRVLSWNLAATSLKIRAIQVTWQARANRGSYQRISMLKCIEQSREVVESIRVNEDLVRGLSPAEGRDWERQIPRLNNNVISHSVRRHRGKHRSHLVWNVLVGRRVLFPVSILMFPRRSLTLASLGSSRI